MVAAQIGEQPEQRTVLARAQSSTPVTADAAEKFTVIRAALLAEAATVDAVVTLSLPCPHLMIVVIQVVVMAVVHLSSPRWNSQLLLPPAADAALAKPHHFEAAEDNAGFSMEQVQAMD